MAPTTTVAPVRARPGAARLALAHPPDHEDGRAPEHPGDGARPRRRDLVRRRLGEPRGARGASAQAYQEIVSDPALFHKSGGYTATLGDLECREQLAPLRGAPLRRAAARRRSTSPSAWAARSSRTTCSGRCVDPGDTVMLLDPTYANYEGQLAFAAPGVQHRPAAGDRPGDLDLPAGDRSGSAWPATSRGCSTGTSRKLVLFGAPDNPTSQIVPQALAERCSSATAAAGAWLAIDFAYKCQYFADAAGLLRAGRRPIIRHVIGIHSNSKWAPRPGTAARLDRGAPTPVIDAIERVQQCSILCPDTLSQMAMARYLSRADRRRIAARATSTTPTRSTARRRASRSTPWTSICSGRGSTRRGGLYTVVDVGRDADAVRARGAQGHRRAGRPGPRLRPVDRQRRAHLVRSAGDGHERITEGLRRLGRLDAGLTAGRRIRRRRRRPAHNWAHADETRWPGGVASPRSCSRTRRLRKPRRPRRPSRATWRRSSSRSARPAIARARWRRCRCSPTRTPGPGRGPSPRR